MLIITGILLLAIIVLGFLNPIFLKNKEENWEEELNSRIELIENNISDELILRQKLLVNELQKIKDSLAVQFKNSGGVQPLLLGTTRHDDKYILAVFDTSKHLIKWDYSSVIQKNKLIDNYFRAGETYFFSNSLVNYLSVYDTIKTEDNFYYVTLFEAVQKNYTIENKYFDPLSIEDKYSREFSTEFEFNFFREAQNSRDGRKFSFPILNNNNNKIGTVTFVKPMRDVELEELNNKFEVLQSLLIILLICFLGLFVFKYVNHLKYRLLRFTILSFYIIALRTTIYLTNITSLFSDWEISNSKYFSSLFAYGIAGSPLELFLTIIAISVVIGLAFKYSLEYFQVQSENSNANWINFIAYLSAFSVLYFITLRGFGASIKSIVLDSTLRYYKESSLFPSFIEYFMLFNVLIIGVIFFVGLLSLLVLIYANVPKKLKSLNYFFGFFMLFQIGGIIYDISQKEPQGTPIFRVLFILFSFIALYFIIRKNTAGIKELFIYSIVSSILVILLLTQYNSLAERESLRRTAYNLTRQNEDLLRYAVQETLVRGITDRETVQSFNLENTNASSVAFKLWSNSILQKESLGSSVALLDREHSKIGSFDFRFSRELEIDWDQYSYELSDLHEIKIFEEEVLYSDNKIIRGIATVENVEGVLGYITVSVIYDLSSLGLLEAPEFMVSDAGYINDAIDYTKLKIYDFHQGTLINSISNYNLSEGEIIAILDATYNEYGEAWMNLDINNENHLVFILKRDQDNVSRVLTVALKEKELSWGLFDFFKIFFTHLIIILAAFLIYFSYFLVKYKSVKFSFATKLLLSFILVSLAPLILVSFFFRSVTTDKNDGAIEYKLSKRASAVEHYLDTYLSTSNLNVDAISEKATSDLGIDFTLFKIKDFRYSSNGQYYDVGLIPKIINPIVYEKLFAQGLNETLVKEKIENYSFNSLYHKTSLLGEFHVIKITDGFNKIMLPLSGQEVDVYIFVSYSVAILIILLLGFILTNQISKPIERLKNATRSIAGGDLSIEIKESSNDEVGELVKGFNYMVKELKRSQTELAEFERETAWKEMAKQVAHEIKNPLTPMKLSVQQLKAAHDDKSPKFEQLFDKVTKTIIDQIETLKNIASEFSSFARMPNPKVELVNLKNLIADAADLFSDEKVIIEINCYDYNIEADKDQLRRVFINLIRNSIQADADSIKIESTTDQEYITILFRDNGNGIDQENVEKIFEVNFSTKQSGMGIGLSMAKKTIENIGGEINLNETNNNGTIFEIKIPLA